MSPGGARGNVAVIGRDGSGLAPHTFRGDVFEAARLGLELGLDGGSAASIGGVMMQAAGTTDRLATYLGAPCALLRCEGAGLAGDAGGCRQLSGGAFFRTGCRRT